MSYNIGIFSDLYKLIKDIISDARCISNKYQKDKYLIGVLPNLYNEIKKIHEEYIKTFGTLCNKFEQDFLSIKELQYELEDAQYLNKAARAEFIAKINVLLQEGWPIEAYSILNSMKSYFSVIYKLNDYNEFYENIDFPNDLKEDGVQDYILHQIRKLSFYGCTHYTYTYLLIQIKLYFDTKEKSKRDQIFKSILESNIGKENELEIRYILQKQKNPLKKETIIFIMKDIINQIDKKFRYIVTCYELFNLNNRNRL